MLICIHSSGICVEYDNFTCGVTKKWNDAEVESKFLMLLPGTALASFVDVVLDIIVISNGYSGVNKKITIILVTCRINCLC